MKPTVKQLWLYSIAVFTLSAFVKWLELVDVPPEEHLSCPKDYGQGCDAYIADGEFKMLKVTS